MYLCCYITGVIKTSRSSFFVGHSVVKPFIPFILENVQVLCIFHILWNFIPHISVYFSLYNWNFQVYRITWLPSSGTYAELNHLFLSTWSCPWSIFQTWIISPRFCLFSREIKPTFSVFICWPRESRGHCYCSFFNHFLGFLCLLLARN